eukprot:scaffold73692_cov106-Phaeocystis_antarctica.AAC.1
MHRHTLHTLDSVAQCFARNQNSNHMLDCGQLIRGHQYSLRSSSALNSDYPEATSTVFPLAVFGLRGPQRYPLRAVVEATPRYKKCATCWTAGEP